jgi:acylphosphatase
MANRLHVVVSGQVQGVGFRQSTFAEATRVGLTGWVRNLPDGRVEAVFDGDQATQEHMLYWCNRGPMFARVTHVETHWDPPDESLSSFDIRF